MGALLPLAVVAGPAIGAQPASPGWEPPRSPTLTITRVSTPPDLSRFAARDLRAEDVAGLTLVTGFVQREPQDGTEASERTEVYLGFDDTHVYALFRAFDRDPRGVRAHLNRRDNVEGDEQVTLTLDTFGDQRRAYVFRCNPLGVQWDATLTEGQERDRSFDTVWQSKGQRTDWGFVVWMAVPFRSLRFVPEGGQDWGIVLERETPRGNGEHATWPWISRSIDGFLNQAALLRTVEAKTPARNYQLIPYGTYRAHSLVDPENGESAGLTRQPDEWDVGLDLKTVFADRLVLDFTVNPDFSQVESDEPQVTVNRRFEVFFPERRPFFLENADLFETPINLLFTRRILDPSLGARLTGKLGRFSLGTLLTDDGGPGKLISEGEGAGDRARVAIVRLRRDVGAQSNIGVLYTHRDFLEDRNRVAALDGRFKLDPNWVTQLQVAVSETAGADGASVSDSALHAQVHRSGAFFNLRSRFRSIGEDFETDLGFVPRTDIRDASAFLSWFWRPEDRRLVRWGSELDVTYRTDQAGLRLDQGVEGSLEWEWRNQTTIELNYEQGKERLRPGDVPGLEIPLDFDIDQWTLELQTEPTAAVGVEAELFTGRTVNFEPPTGQAPRSGEEQGAEVELVLRPGKSLRIDNRFLFTRLRDPESHDVIFDDWILRSKWNWQISIPFSVRVILQWEETAPDARLTSIEPRSRLNGDFLLTYRVNPFTAFYVGYNQNRSELERELRRRIGRDDGGRLVKDGEQVFVKVSYLIR